MSDSNVLIITNCRLVVVKVSKTTIEWIVPFDGRKLTYIFAGADVVDVRSVRQGNDGIVVVQKGEGRQRFITCPDSSSAQVSDGCQMSVSNFSLVAPRADRRCCCAFQCGAQISGLKNTVS